MELHHQARSYIVVVIFAQSLSKTSITYEGVKTDQKDVSQEIKVYSDQTYSEKYQQISRFAHQTLANVSVPQRGSVLQPADSERIGSDATPPGAIQRDESTRERTATVIDTSDQDESSIPVIESSGESPSDDEDLFITVSGTAAKMKGPTQVRFKEILNTPVATETQKTNKNEPGKLKQIWTSILNFFSSGIGPFRERPLPEPIPAQSAADILNLTDPENDFEADIVDRESNVIFSNIPLKVKSAQSKEADGIKYEYQDLSIEALERIVTETAKVDGKVKIRANKGMLQNGVLILRAGHRASKPGKTTAKGIGTGNKSKSAMHVMIDAFQHHQKRLNEKIENLIILERMLSDLENIQIEQKTHWRGKNLDDLLTTANNLNDNYLQCDELEQFIKAVQDFESNRNSDELFTVFKEKAQALEEFLNRKDDGQLSEKENQSEMENLSEKEKLYQRLKNQQASISDELLKLQSSYKVLANTRWGKAVIDKNSAIKGKASQLLKDLQSLQKMADSFYYKLNPDKRPEDKSFVKLSEFFDAVFSSADAELRTNFENHYRWYFSSEKYIELLHTRYEDNKGKLSAFSDDAELDSANKQEKDKILAEQKNVLEMFANWASSPRIDGNEIDLKIEDGMTIRNTLKSIAGEIAETEQYSEIHTKLTQELAAQESTQEDDATPEEFRSAIRGIADEIAETEQYSEIHTKLTQALAAQESTQEDEVRETTGRNFQADLKKVSDGQYKKIIRNELVSEYCQQLTDAGLSIMQDILPSEFARQAWNDKINKSNTSPNILNGIAYFNKLVNYLQLNILTVFDEEGRKDATFDQQSNMIAFLIDVQTQAIAQRDMNTAMAINSALNSSSIHRLKKAWNQKPASKKLDQLQQNTTILNQALNYAELRKVLNENDDAVPYFGMFLRDLTFLDDANPWTKKSDAESTEEQINVYKFNAISNIVDKVLRFQKNRERVAADHAINHEINDVNQTASDDSKVYEISLRVQPRSKTQ